MTVSELSGDIGVGAFACRAARSRATADYIRRAGLSGRESGGSARRVTSVCTARMKVTAPSRWISGFRFGDRRRLSPLSTRCGHFSRRYNGGMMYRPVRSFVLAICAVMPFSGVAFAEPARSVPPAADKSLAVGDDVVASARRWLTGNLEGRSDLEALAAKGRSDAQEMLGEILGPDR